MKTLLSLVATFGLIAAIHAEQSGADMVIPSGHMRIHVLRPQGSLNLNTTLPDGSKTRIRNVVVTSPSVVEATIFRVQGGDSVQLKPVGAGSTLVKVYPEAPAVPYVLMIFCPKDSEELKQMEETMRQIERMDGTATAIDSAPAQPKAAPAPSKDTKSLI